MAWKRAKLPENYNYAEKVLFCAWMKDICMEIPGLSHADVSYDMIVRPNIHFSKMLCLEKYGMRVIKVPIKQTWTN